MPRTRHGNYGGPRAPYGSFAGKSVAGYDSPGLIFNARPRPTTFNAVARPTVFNARPRPTTFNAIDRTP